MLVLGIVCRATSRGHPIKNGSTALLDGNKLQVCVAEERLTGTKNAAGSQRGIELILSEYLRGDLPDKVVISTCCESAASAQLDESYLPLFLGARLTKSPSHHYSHALMAYSLSPFDRALVGVVDAGGNTEIDAVDGRWWSVPREQMTFYVAEGGVLTVAHRSFFEPGVWGIGEIYRAFTKFLGLGGQTASGKTMGLAAYGKPHALSSAVLFDLLPEGQLRSKVDLGQPRDAAEGVAAFLSAAGMPVPVRTGQHELSQDHADIAAFLQREVERAVCHVVGHLVSRYSIRNLCLAGGVALNCPTNTLLLARGVVDRLFIPPCPGDDGQSLGNALIPLASESRTEKPVCEMRNAFYGPERPSSAEDVKRLLGSLQQDTEVITRDVIDSAVDLLVGGGIVGWFQGRSEVGPRALGHRCILADPRRRESRERLSRFIKGRELFRPYAATVLDEHRSDWFDLPDSNPHMLLLGRMLEHTRLVAPALVHADNTCRVQTLRDEAPEFRMLISGFRDRTGVPFLLNTSLNLAGRPLVETASDAVEMFAKTDLDALVIGDCLVQRRRKPNPPELLTVSELRVAPAGVDADARLTLNYPGMPFCRRTYFGLKREYCDWILLGKKVTTVRYSPGALDVAADTNLPVVARPGGETLFAVNISALRFIPFGSLSQNDARRDGFRTLRALKDALRSFYGEVPEWHPVTIYEILPLVGFDSLRGRRIAEP